MTKILFSVMRNEAPFLLEWVAYHRQLGFDKIVIYSNRSTDGTHELLDALARSGAIVHKRLDGPEGVPPQRVAIDHFMTLGLLALGDVVMFMDADEFLNIKIGDRSLDALIDHIGDAQGMAVAWRRFGDSGNRTFRGRFIKATYPMAEPRQSAGDPLCKTLFRVGPEFARIGIHKPHFAPEFWDTGQVFLSADGKPVLPESEDYRNWIDPERQPFVARSSTNYDVAQVNHYQFRSAAALAMKYKRGVGAGTGSSEREKYNTQNVHKLNTNHEPDTSVLYYEAATQAEMARLLQNNAVQESHDAAVQMFKDYEDKFHDTTPEPKTGRAMKRFLNLIKGDTTPEPESGQSGRTPRLIMHVGQMKTGTTTLQHHLQGSAQELASQGVYYPKSDLPSSAHHEVSAYLALPEEAPDYAAVLAGGQDEARDAGRALIERTKTWLGDNPNGTAILSTETITGWNNVGIGQRLKQMVEDIAGDNYLVVAYVRSPLSGAMSRLQQSLYGQTLLKPPVGGLHMAQLNVFADAFGDRFKVRLFDRKHLVRGDIVHDFYASFLPQVPSLAQYQTSPSLNQSLSAEAMILVQDAKLQLSPDGAPIITPETNLLFNEIRNLDTKVDGYVTAKIKPELLAQLMCFQNEALELREAFGITFSDIDYSQIGKRSDLDLESLRYVRNIAQFDPDRLERLRQFILEDGEKVKRMLNLIEASARP